MKTQISRLILEKCAQTLQEMIAPSLNSPYLVEQVMSIVMLLRTLTPNLEESARVVGKENQKMKEVLEKTLEYLRKQDSLSQNPTRNGLVQQIEGVLKGAAAQAEEVEQENVNLREVLIKVITALKALKNELPVETLSSLRSQIGAVIRQQVDNEVAWAGGKRLP